MNSIFWIKTKLPTNGWLCDALLHESFIKSKCLYGMATMGKNGEETGACVYSLYGLDHMSHCKWNVKLSWIRGLLWLAQTSIGGGHTLLH